MQYKGTYITDGNGIGMQNTTHINNDLKIFLSYLCCLCISDIIYSAMLNFRYSIEPIRKLWKRNAVSIQFTDKENNSIWQIFDNHNCAGHSNRVFVECDVPCCSSPESPIVLLLRMFFLHLQNRLQAKVTTTITVVMAIITMTTISHVHWSRWAMVTGKEVPV